MSTLLSTYKKKLLLLAVMCLAFVVQARAQFFEDDGGPGDFEPPPDNDVPLDTYQWVMMGLALMYGFYIFWKHHQKKKGGPAASSGILITPVFVTQQATFNQFNFKTNNHDTVFSFSRSAHSYLPGLPGCTGKGKKKSAPVLRLRHAQEKRKNEPQSRLNNCELVNHEQKPSIMRSIFPGLNSRATRYRAILIVATLMSLIPALANDGSAASIPVKGRIPLSYYEGFMISVAAVYGIYLVIRARRRKRDSKFPQ